MGTPPLFGLQRYKLFTHIKILGYSDLLCGIKRRQGKNLLQRTERTNAASKAVQRPDLRSAPQRVSVQQVLGHGVQVHGTGRVKDPVEVLAVVPSGEELGINPCPAMAVAHQSLGLPVRPSLALKPLRRNRVAGNLKPMLGKFVPLQGIEGGSRSVVAPGVVRADFSRRRELREFRPHRLGRRRGVPLI